MRLNHQKAIAKKNQSFADAFDGVVVVTFAPLGVSHTFAYVVVVVVASVVPMSLDMVEAVDVLRVAFVGVIVVMVVVVVVVVAVVVDN